MSQDAVGGWCFRRIAGRFQDDALADTQLASWYGPGLEVTYGEWGRFEPYTEYTAASPYLPFGTDLLVTYGAIRGRRGH